MLAYRSGDRAAFRVLFERHAPRLQSLCLRRGLDRAEAEDLVQQTFLNLHRARFDFREDARLRPWLYTIAFNLLRQRVRRSSRRPVTSLEFEPAATRGDPERARHREEIRRGLDQLPHGQRDAIVLHWFGGLTFEEVGQVVGAKTSAVKVRAHRGYAKLREILSDELVTQMPTPA